MVKRINELLVFIELLELLGLLGFVELLELVGLLGFVELLELVGFLGCLSSQLRSLSYMEMIDITH